MNNYYTSFQTLRTNPALTTNIKVVIDTNYKIYLEAYSINKELSDVKYRHFAISKDSKYDEMLYKFFSTASSTSAFLNKYDTDNTLQLKDYSYQYDTTYWAGAAQIEDQWYPEEYEYMAPLHIHPEKMPKNFIVLRVDDPVIYNQETGYKIYNTTTTNFRTEIVEKWKAVQVYDLSFQSDFGYWLSHNIVTNKSFPKVAFEFDPQFPRWFGIDYDSGTYTNKVDSARQFTYYEQPHFKLEKYITEGYANTKLVYPHLFNFKFLFNDTPATPTKIKKYSINRYYGFYVEEMDWLMNLTTYQPPLLVDDLKIQNNIFMNINQLTGSTLPFVSGWDDSKEYYVYGKGKLHSVQRIKENNEYFYKLITDVSLNISDINNNGIVNIKYYNTGNTYYNSIVGYQHDLQIDPYIAKDDSQHGLYGDLYLINIDGKYHVITSEINQESTLYASGGTVFSATTSCTAVAIDFNYIFRGLSSGSIYVTDYFDTLQWSGASGIIFKDIKVYNNIVYAATNQGIFIKDFSILTNTEQWITTSNSNLQSNDLISIALRDNLIAVGDTSNQWWINNVSKYSGSTGNVPSTITSMAIDDNYQLYVSYGNTFRRFFDFDNVSYVEYNPSNTPSLPNATITNIIVENNIIYLSSLNGFWIKNGPLEKLYNTTTGFNLGSNQIIDFKKYNDKAYLYVYAGTSTDGIYILKYLENDVEIFSGSSYGIITNASYLDVSLENVIMAGSNGYQLFNLPVNSSTTIKYDYFINSDYAINSDNSKLEYWIGGNTSTYYTSKTIENKGETPLSYSIYRAKFLPIRDFDFDRVDTGFADFDYEQTEYVDTDEIKLNAVEYRDTSFQKALKVMPDGSSAQGRIMNVASEYASGDELWEIQKTGQLTDLWRKNENICKWTYVGSISHSDYPYKLNNNQFIGGPYNRTANVYSTNSDISDKNLDYFYRIGNLKNVDYVFITGYSNSIITGDNYSIYTQSPYGSIFSSGINGYSYYWNGTTTSAGGTYDFIYTDDLIPIANFTGQKLKVEVNLISSTGLFQLFNFGLYTLNNIHDPLYRTLISNSVTVPVSAGTQTFYFVPTVTGGTYTVTLGGVPSSGGIQDVFYTAKTYVEVDNYYYTVATNKYYKQQSTNIQDDFFNVDSKKFSLPLYVTSKFDYFDYFFNNYMYIEDNNILYTKGTSKFSTFNEYSLSLFKGVLYNLLKVNNINYNGNFITQIVTDNNFKYSGYKCSVIYNPVYDFVTDDYKIFERVTVSQPLMWYNPLYLNAKDWYGNDYGVRGYDSGNTYSFNLNTSTVNNLTYKVEKELTLVQKWNIDNPDQMVFKKSSGRYFFKVSGYTNVITPSDYNFYDVDIDKEFVNFSGSSQNYYSDVNLSPVTLMQISPITSITYNYVDTTRQLVPVWQTYPGIFQSFTSSNNTFTAVAPSIGYSNNVCFTNGLSFTNSLGQVYKLVVDVTSKQADVNMRLYIQNGNITASNVVNINYGHNEFYLTATTYDVAVSLLCTLTNGYPNGTTQLTAYLYPVVVINTGQSNFTYVNLQNWDDTDFNNNYINWLNNGLLYEIDGLAGTGEGVDDPTQIMNNSLDGINIFLNDKYKNLVMIINEKVSLKEKYISLNNVTIMGNNHALYYGETLNKDNLKMPDVDYTFTSQLQVHESLSILGHNYAVSANTMRTSNYVQFEGRIFSDVIELPASKKLAFDIIGNGSVGLYFFTGITESEVLQAFQVGIESYYYSYSGSFNSGWIDIQFNVGSIFDPGVKFIGIKLTTVASTVLFETIMDGNPGANEHQPNKIIANKICSALNNLNDKTGFEQNVTYHYIDSAGTYSYYVMGSNGVVPPYVLQAYPPQDITLKYHSYNIDAIKGPKYNIYDKYKPIGVAPDTKYNINEPLARRINIDETEPPILPQSYGETAVYNKTISRFKGPYQPYFRDINLFNKSDYTYDSNNNLLYYSSGYRFDEQYLDFAQINELKYTKINPDAYVLRLANIEGDTSIYPMCDEFGYSWTDRFIFKSAWDTDYFLRTEKDAEN